MLDCIRPSISTINTHDKKCVICCSDTLQHFVPVGSHFPLVMVIGLINPVNNPEVDKDRRGCVYRIEGKQLP